MLSQQDLDTCAICHECDLLVEIGNLPDGYKATCPRCRFTITCAHPNALDNILVFALTALLCLLLSNLFDFVHIVMQGQYRGITLVQTIQELFALDAWMLGAIMLVVIIGLPTLFTLLLCWLVLAIKLRRVSPATIRILQVVGYMRFWNMAEIFFLGILVSMVKLASMANIEVGYSFWSYACFNLFMIAAMTQLDKVQLAQAIRRISRAQTNGKQISGNQSSGEQVHGV